VNYQLRLLFLGKIEKCLNLFQIFVEVLKSTSIDISHSTYTDGICLLETGIDNTLNLECSGPFISFLFHQEIHLLLLFNLYLLFSILLFLSFETFFL